MRLSHSHLKRAVVAFAAVMVLVAAMAQRPLSGSNTVIVTSSQATSIETLAAKELRRYIFLTTGEWLPLVNDRIDAGKNLILVATKTREFIKQASSDDLKGRLAALADQQYIIKTLSRSNDVIVLISGGDDFGTLYGAYRFIEELGVRFYLHDDVVPEVKTALQPGNLDINGKPLFALRGILPFHDFPEGPDWWSRDDYKAYIAQLPKMRMNFIGFHSYPESQFEGRYKAEPMVWVGTKDQINGDGTVKSAGPTTHAYTRDETWGTQSRKTSGFSFGASQLFDADYYGAPYMENISAWPHTGPENIKLFNDFGELLRDAFGFARKLGVKTCLGTEAPLSVPQNVWEKLYLEGKDADTQAETKQAVYEGLFTRIMKTHPLDYYWLWTPEFWTWRQEPNQAVVLTEMDLFNAAQAMHKVNATFTLATCGWVLGPSRDRTEFDKVLPKDMPFSCINRQFGFTPVDPGFKAIQDRPKWAIPWLEYDWPLVEPQLWAGRVRRDALDAHDYGCNGLIGIHWRTQILSPQIGALAQAGWEFGDWTNHPDAGARDLPVYDFYRDWANAQFGKGSEGIARVFTSLDGGPLCDDAYGHARSNLPRASAWGGNGPGLLMINLAPWSQMVTNYAFVDALAGFENQIHGAANKERFSYWLNMFRYMKALAHTGCVLGEMETTMEAVVAETNQTKQVQMINEVVMPLRKQVAERWGEMVTFLLATVGTPGEMGTIANLESHSLGAQQLLTRHDRAISVLSGKPVAPIELGRDYRGSSRIIMPTKRTLLETNEDLNVKVMILSQGKVKSVTLYWRPLGKGEGYQTIEARHVARGVYNAVIPAAAINGQDFEYYVQAGLESETLKYPVTAPALNQSVVVN